MRGKKEKKERIALIIDELKKIYPEATCALEFNGEPWKLLVMGRLSAQCTDARVNIVCRELFEKYPTIKDLSEADIIDVVENNETYKDINFIKPPPIFNNNIF